MSQDLASEFSNHPPEPKIFWRAAGVAFLLEALLVMLIGYWQHWLAHPSHAGLDDSRFIEAEVFEVPKDEPRLVEEKKAAKPQAIKEATLSKTVDQGRVAKPEENQLSDENKTDSGTSAVANHGPVAIFSPAPVIPAYLQDKDLHASVVIDFFVNAQGQTIPRLVGSSGNEELDAIAVATAKKWQFRSAEKDHKAIDAKVRLRINFDVK